MVRGVNIYLKIMNEMLIEFRYILIIKLELEFNEIVEEVYKYVIMSIIMIFCERNIL